MTFVLIAAACIGVVATVCAVALAVANRFISVKEDPRIGQAASILPGANCGGCGFAGCADYARAMVLSDAPLNKCPVGGPDVVNELSHLFGRDSGGSGEKMVAYPFEGYWKDVGTISSLWEANMDLLAEQPEIDLHDKKFLKGKALS